MGEVVTACCDTGTWTSATVEGRFATAVTGSLNEPINSRITAPTTDSPNSKYRPCDHNSRSPLPVGRGRRHFSILHVIRRPNKDAATSHAQQQSNEIKSPLATKHQSTTKAFAVHQTLAPLSYRLETEAPPTCGRSTWLLYRQGLVQTSHRICSSDRIDSLLGNKVSGMEAHASLRPAHEIANALAMSVPF